MDWSLSLVYELIFVSISKETLYSEIQPEIGRVEMNVLCLHINKCIHTHTHKFIKLVIHEALLPPPPRDGSNIQKCSKRYNKVYVQNIYYP